MTIGVAQGLPGVQKKWQESVGICNRLLTPCHTRLRRPRRGPFSYQGVSTKGVRHSPARFTDAQSRCFASAFPWRSCGILQVSLRYPFPNQREKLREGGEGIGPNLRHQTLTPYFGQLLTRVRWHFAPTHRHGTVTQKLCTFWYSANTREVVALVCRYGVSPHPTRRHGPPKGAGELVLRENSQKASKNITDDIWHFLPCAPKCRKTCLALFSKTVKWEMGWVMVGTPFLGTAFFPKRCKIGAPQKQPFLPPPIPFPTRCPLIFDVFWRGRFPPAPCWHMRNPPPPCEPPPPNKCLNFACARPCDKSHGQRACPETNHKLYSGTAQSFNRCVVCCSCFLLTVETGVGLLCSHLQNFL